METFEDDQISKPVHFKEDEANLAKITEQISKENNINSHSQSLNGETQLDIQSKNQQTMENFHLEQQLISPITKQSFKEEPLTGILKNSIIKNESLSGIQKQTFITNSIQQSKVENELDPIEADFDQIKRTHIAELLNYREKDYKYTRRNIYQKTIVEKNEMMLCVVKNNRIEMNELYHDRFPFLRLRKQINKARIYVNMTASKIITTKIFENACLGVICLNSLSLAMSDPLEVETTIREAYVDNIFLAAYTTEMCLKILAYGFFFNEGAYIRNPWNILDFVIVMSAYLTLFQKVIATIANGGVTPVVTYENANQGGLSLNSLRAFRVLRPLKAVTAIKGLKTLVSAVISSLPLLQDTIMILISFFLVFGIATLQLLSGVLKQVCVNIEDSSLTTVSKYGGCGALDVCPEGYYCGKQNANPNLGITNFDNIFFSVLMVFQITTLRGWSDIMYNLMANYSKYSWIICVPIVYIGSHFLTNLLLAVVNSSFGEAQAKQKMKTEEEQSKLRALKEKPSTGDDFDDDIPIEQIGVIQYWIAKRAAKKLLERARANIQRKAELRKQAGALSLFADDAALEELVAKVEEPPVTMQPKAPKQNVEKEYNHSDQIKRLLNDSGNLNSDEDDDRPKVKAQKKDLSLQIKYYAVNDMATSHKYKNKAKEKKDNQIETADQDFLAIKQPQCEAMTYKGSMKDIDRLEERLNLTQILKKADEDDNNNSDFRHPFDLSQKHSNPVQLIDVSDSDEDLPRKKRNNKYARKSAASDDELSSVIASESSFERHIEKNDMNVKQEGFKLNQSIENQEEANQIDKAGVDEAQQVNAQSNQDDAKKKAAAKKKKKLRRKKKEDKKSTQQKYQTFLEIIRNVDEEFLSEQRSKTPQDYINIQTHKIEIMNGVPYRSTSTADIFEIRNRIAQEKALENANIFVKSSTNDQNIDSDEDDFDGLMEKEELPFKAFQLKTVYKVFNEEPVEFDDNDDDAIILAIQPFDTVTNVGYGHLLTHTPVRFNFRRSDIIVSSTLQVTLTPADSGYKPLDHALLSKESITDWVNKRHEYRALQIQTATFIDDDQDDNGGDKDPKVDVMFTKPSTMKDKNMTQHESNSLVDEHQQDDELSKKQSSYKASILTEKATKLIPPTLLRKPLPPEKLNQLTEDEKRLYAMQKSKYDTYIRICTKKSENGEHPVNRKFTIQEVESLMNGKIHEEDDEDEIFEYQYVPQYLGRNDLIKKKKIEEFEDGGPQNPPTLNKIQKARGLQNHIPQEIRIEFDLPENMRNDLINFDEVIKFDCSHKRKIQTWSGQDILDVGLTTELSNQVIVQINSTRVWPKGFVGTLKKGRVGLKMIVKNDFFNNLMTIFVFLNTIVMGMQKNNMSTSESARLDNIGNIFTWIFICEFASKLIALGVVKYLRDKMNWLDGSIVSLSILEILLTAFSGGGGGNLKAFKTLRVFRTFRVFRMARILRKLPAMKIIINVVARSIGSISYVTLLLFVFIFIYTLLGMQVIGGQLGSDPPALNFDNFITAWLTSFVILTLDGWNIIMYYTMTTKTIGMMVPCFYLLSWIFIGNYILLNLFLAILLDGFASEDNEEEEDNEEVKLLNQKIRNAQIKKEKQRRLKKLGANIIQIKDEEDEQKEESKNNEQEQPVDDIDDLHLETIREIFMEQGLIKKKDPEREKRLMYFGIKAEKSQYLWSKKNPVRIFAVKLMKNKLFDQTIMFLIGCSSCKLAADSYSKYYAPDSIEIKISENIDIFLNLAFLFECITKNIAMGTIMDEGSYLQNNWNRMDGFIVFTSMLDMCLVNVNIPALKILRLLRTLRPLRVISHNVEMKLMVAAIFESMGALLNVSFVVLCVWMMFSIFAINIFSQKFSYCDIGKYVYSTKYDCNVNGGTWLNYSANFDDIFQATLTLFTVASLEVWSDQLIHTIEATGIDKGPQPGHDPVMGFFLVVFVLIGSFFMMNFFIGVLFMKFEQATEREKKGYTHDNLAWIAIQKMIIKQRCEFELMNKPDKILFPERYKYWRIVTSNPFDLFIMAIIVLNIIQMGMNFEDASLFYMFLLDISNYGFTAVFIMEMYFKVRAYGWRYFQSNQHKFDSFIVFSSIADIIMNFTPTKGNFQIGPQMARMLRVLRVTRIVRLAKKNVGLQALMSTITLSVGALFNVFLLLMLGIFIFSTLATYFFGEIIEGDIIDEYHNFENFGTGFLYGNVISTGEHWNELMYDLIKTPPDCEVNVNCGSSYSPVYFIFEVMMIAHIMLSLFILVIIQQFETYYMAVDNPIVKFKKSLTAFMVIWVEFTATKQRCIRLREKKLIQFFKRLPAPIGLPADTQEEDLKKVMMKMGIKCDDGYVYFNELLYRCMRRQYGTFKLNKIMQANEIKTQYKIFLIKLAAQSPTGISLHKNPHELFFQKTIGHGTAVNPFLQHMYFSISFETWLNYARREQKKLKFQQKQEIKKQQAWLEGIDYEPQEFPEQDVVKKTVMIELEEICEFFSSEGEEHVSEILDESFEKVKFDFNDRKAKKKIQPQCGAISQGLQIIGKKKSHSEEDFLILGIGRHMNRDSIQGKLMRVQRKQQKIIDDQNRAAQTEIVVTDTQKISIQQQDSMEYSNQTSIKGGVKDLEKHQTNEFEAKDIVSLKIDLKEINEEEEDEQQKE